MAWLPDLSFRESIMKRHHPDSTAWNKKVEKGDKETGLQAGEREKGNRHTAGGGEAHSPRALN